MSEVTAVFVPGTRTKNFENIRVQLDANKFKHK